VTNTAGVTSHKNIVITSSGFAVYTLTDDSARHPECTKANSCFQFWPPVTVSASAKLIKSAAIRGTLGRWHRDGFAQLTLSGHPLYRFRDDSRPRAATGEGIMGFGGTWHVVSTGSDSAASGRTQGAPTSTTSTTSTAQSSTKPSLTTSTYSAPSYTPQTYTTSMSSTTVAATTSTASSTGTSTYGW